MAWTNISNALVAVGALPFATTIQALRDNPVAIANGDAGAPRNTDASLSTTVTAAGTSWVGARVATFTATSVGATIFAMPSAGGPYAANATISGSSLSFSGVRPNVSDVEGVLRIDVDVTSSGSPGVGTWRCMGYSSTDTESGVTSRGATNWLRIA